MCHGRVICHVMETRPNGNQALVVAFCIIIHTVYSTGCYDKCFKNGEHQKLFVRHNLWCTELSEQEIYVIFPGFQVLGRFFQLKHYRQLRQKDYWGGVYREWSNLLCRNH